MRLMWRRRVIISSAVLAILLGSGYAATPYARSLLLVVRAANLGGSVEAFADRQSREVTVRADTALPTRHGDVPMRLYAPTGRFDRTVLLIPGIHAAGI